MNYSENTKEKEFQLISVLLDDDERYINEIEKCYQQLKPKFFSDPQAKFTYEVMRSVYLSRGRTATIDDIDAINNGKHAGLKEYLNEIKTQALFYRESLQTFCDAIYNAYMNDRIISLKMNEGTDSELYSRLNELISDIDDYNNSIDEKTANVLECITSGKYQKDIERQVNNQEIPTGFSILDKRLGSSDGKKGLFPERLYVLGAIPSLGKTTFVHQIADNIARSGTPVLFFSLEQSQNELIGKSIVREQFKFREALPEKKRNYEVSPLNVINKIGLRQPHVQAAIEAYKATAENMYIYEGNFNTSISTIRATAKQFIRRNHKTPVIIIDYLQLLKPVNEKTKDPFMIVGENVNALKVLARETHAPVLVISAFSRDKGYNNAPSFTAYRGSSNIEYSADTVLALALDIGDKKDYQQAFNEMNEEKPNKPSERSIKLECLKNRGGQSTFTCYYSYKPKFEYFEERDTSRG